MIDLNLLMVVMGWVLIILFAIFGGEAFRIVYMCMAAIVCLIVGVALCWVAYIYVVHIGAEHNIAPCIAKVCAIGVILLAIIVGWKADER